MNVCPACWRDKSRPRDLGGCACGTARPKQNALGQVRRKRAKRTRVVLRPTDGDAA